MDGDKGVSRRGAALDIKCHQEMEELAGTRLRGTLGNVNYFPRGPDGVAEDEASHRCALTLSQRDQEMPA